MLLMPLRIRRRLRRLRLERAERMAELGMAPVTYDPLPSLSLGVVRRAKYFLRGCRIGFTSENLPPLEELLGSGAITHKDIGTTPEEVLDFSHKVVARGQYETLPRVPRWVKGELDITINTPLPIPLSLVLARVERYNLSFWPLFLFPILEARCLVWESLHSDLGGEEPPIIVPAELREQIGEGVGQKVVWRGKAYFVFDLSLDDAGRTSCLGLVEADVIDLNS